MNHHNHDSDQSVSVVIEDPAGSTERHHYDSETGTWRSRLHHATSEPWPASYGYIERTWVDADNDELDVIVISSSPISTGSHVRVIPVALLERPDGDHKVLATLWSDADYGELHRLSDIPSEEISQIEDWFRAWGEPGKWHNELEAWATITRAQQRYHEQNA